MVSANSGILERPQVIRFLGAPEYSVWLAESGAGTAASDDLMLTGFDLKMTGEMLKGKETSGTGSIEFAGGPDFRQQLSACDSFRVFWGGECVRRMGWRRRHRRSVIATRRPY